MNSNAQPCLVPALLITCAHQREARAICDAAKKIFGSSAKVLVTGEGPFEALYAVTGFLTQHSPLQRILNVGFAGALRDDPHLQIGTAVEVGSCYLHRGGDQWQFSSFTGNPASEVKLVSNVTSFERISAYHEREMLAPFGACVDRELWGVAYSAARSKIPWSSLKLISDRALNACEITQQQLPHLLDQLRDYTLEWFLKCSDLLQVEDKEAVLHKSITSQHHFTLTQSRQLKKLIRVASLKQADLAIFKLNKPAKYTKEFTNSYLTNIAAHLNFEVS